MIARKPSVKRADRLQAELDRAKADLEALKKQALGDEPSTLEEWELMPQKMRDDMAARALFQAWGHPYRAAALMGFDMRLSEKTKVASTYRHELVERVFNTAGVQAILQSDLADAAANRQAIVQRQIEIARHGNADQSVRATQMIAKLEHWITPDEAVKPSVHIHLASLVAGVAADRDPEYMKRVAEAAPVTEALAGSASIDDILSHEPGEATRVEDEGHASKIAR